MRDKIYLIGQISVSHAETYEWRKRVKTHFQYSRQFYFIDPCNNEFNKAVQAEYSDGSDPDRTKVYTTGGIDLLVPKDKMYVMKSTGAFANMNHYDEEKPMIGTMFELAWYHDNNHKAVIGIFDGDPSKDKHCNHPFVKSVINTWVKDEEEACYTLDKYFSI